MRFRLRTAHIIGDAHLLPGTEIGEDTPYPLPKGWLPTPDCEPLDKAAEKMVEDMKKDRPPVDPSLVPHQDSDVRPGFAPSVPSDEDFKKRAEAAIKDDKEHEQASPKIPKKG